MQTRKQRGFTLIELLVVVGIIGILSAIAIWNYFIAIQRAKQKKSMADMRSIAMSWEHYAQDFNSYVPAAAVFEYPDGGAVTYGQLHAALVPQYMTTLPEKDGWERAFHFAAGTPDPDNPIAVSAYAIRSMGADGVVDESYDSIKTESFNNDIVFSDGVFIVSPKD